ncbi:MAG: RNA recognition motif domain-containing protein [Tepidiformaceae bacterium]
MNIYIGNISYQTTEDDVSTLFGEHGAVDSVHLISDRETGRSKGFGFVEMPNDEEAKKAIEAVDGSEFGGRQLKVNEARPRPPRR